MNTSLGNYLKLGSKVVYSSTSAGTYTLPSRGIKELTPCEIQKGRNDASSYSRILLPSGGEYLVVGIVDADHDDKSIFAGGSELANMKNARVVGFYMRIS